MSDWIRVASEGYPDEVVLQVLAAHVGVELDIVRRFRGKSELDAKLDAYNHAARHGKWLILRDLDTDADCAPTLVQRLLPNPSAGMNFRIAVREIEAWLLGDAERFAEFFYVQKSRVPPNPETLADPKQTVLQIISRSRSKDVRLDMLPRQGSGAVVGPAYASRIAEFARQRWRPEKASSNCNSLARCIACLNRLS